MKEPFPHSIAEFIQEHHVFTLATVNNNTAWCSNCFYAFDIENLRLIFSSDSHTRHAQEMSENPTIAGSIVLETETIGKIQGLQFTGEAKIIEKENLSHAKKVYLRRFPYAVLKKTTLWECKLTYTKLTDNRLGFGTKLVWQ